MTRTPLQDALAGAVTDVDGGVLVAVSYGDPQREYLALREGVGIVDRSHRGFVAIDGPEAITFLHALVSADVAALEPGQGTHSLLLQPQGKLAVDHRLLRTGDGLLADTEPGFGAELVTALNRLRIRVKAEVHDLAGSWGAFAVRGPQAAATLTAAGAPTPAAAHGHEAWLDARVVRADWPGSPGFDVVGPLPAVAAAWGALVDAGVTRCGTWAAEVVRIEAGVPRQGLDVDGSTIPQEAFLERDAVSFTKGCFLGQELVCRIDTRGRVNRYLRGVVVGTAVVPPVGAEVVAGDKVVGTVTSVGESWGLGAPVGLATVRHEVEPPAEVEVRWPGGSTPARVEALPLVGGDEPAGPVTPGPEAPKPVSTKVSFGGRR